MRYSDPKYSALKAEAARRSDFIADMRVSPRPASWSGYHFARMLRSTGDSPERVAAMLKLVYDLCGGAFGRHPCIGGAFDHGELWCRAGVAAVMVGHPYQIADDERARLADLARSPALRIGIDDRPSYYGFGTHHVRIEVPNPRRPYRQPPATHSTRAFARAARRAFVDAGMAPDSTPFGPLRG